MTRKTSPNATRRASPGATFPGPMTTARFLRQHWQKKPLLVRGAFPGFRDPMDKAGVLRLAGDPDAESRLVRRDGRYWSVEHGPFSRAALSRMPDRDWTVLVQDTNHFSDAAEELLRRFSFVPHARVDDLMVSYAVPGGTVGPHVDSYDVFLIQGWGRRRWKISAPGDLSFVPGLDLRILRRFRAEEEWVLEPGDMLYLPPDVPHYGIAETECLSWSVGFRAPADAELAAAFLDQLGEKLCLEGRYADPGLAPSEAPGAIPAALAAHVRRTLGRIRWTAADADELAGRFLSEPKSHVYFTPRRQPLPPARFAARAGREALRLDRRARLLYLGDRFFLNGELLEVPAPCRAPLRALADSRRLEPDPSRPPAFWRLVCPWHAGGLVHLEGDPR